jgi:hypothetical protein
MSVRRAVDRDQAKGGIADALGSSIRSATAREMVTGMAFASAPFLGLVLAWAMRTERLPFAGQVSSPALAVLAGVCVAGVIGIGAATDTVRMVGTLQPAIVCALAMSGVSPWLTVASVPAFVLLPTMVFPTRFTATSDLRIERLAEFVLPRRRRIAISLAVLCLAELILGFA